MSQYIVNNEDITIIADAMREMSGTDQKYTFPQDFSDYIYTSKKFDGKDLAIALLNDELPVIYSTYFGDSTTSTTYTYGLGNSKNIKIIIFPVHSSFNDVNSPQPSLPASAKFIRFGINHSFLFHYIAGDGAILDFTLSSGCSLEYKDSAGNVKYRSDLSKAKHIIVSDDNFDKWASLRDFLEYKNKLIKSSEFDYTSYSKYFENPPQLDVSVISLILSGHELEKGVVDGMRYVKNTPSVQLNTSQLPRSINSQEAFIPTSFIHSDQISLVDNYSFARNTEITLAPFALFSKKSGAYLSMSNSCVIKEAGPGSLSRMLGYFGEAGWSAESTSKMDFETFCPDIETADAYNISVNTSTYERIYDNLPKLFRILGVSVLLAAYPADVVENIYTPPYDIYEVLTHSMCLLSNCTVVFANNIRDIPDYVFGRGDSTILAGPQDLMATNVIPDVGENITSIGKIFIMPTTKKAIFRQPKDVVVQLPEKLCYSKTAATIDVYTDNDSIKNYDWAKDNFTPTFHSLSELETA